MRLPRPFSFPAPFSARDGAFERAIQQLRNGRIAESAYGQRVALVLTIPTFDDPVARDIRRNARGELYVVRTVWRRALDVGSKQAAYGASAGLRPFMIGVDLPGRPTLVSTQVPVDVPALDSLLATLAMTTVTCQTSQPDPPLDATVFELTFGEKLTEMRYRWAADPPGGWAPLAAFAVRLIRLVDEPARAPAR
jgi:hypothetical protein